MASQDPILKKLGTTSYAVLGLLALRDWTTYELAQQMERGIGRMWAASPSMVYEEPKHLVAHGFATVHDTPVGRRPRSRYSITDKGRRALAEWLGREPEPPALQFEGLLKVVFADLGGAEANEHILAAVGSWAQGARQAAAVRAEGYLAGDYIEGVDLDDRAPVIAQTLGFLADLYDLVERWSTWAVGLAEGADPDAARQVFRRVAGGKRVVR
jgi:DNA-binding PadR family transcriptional regulator